MNPIKEVIKKEKQKKKEEKELLKKLEQEEKELGIEEDEIKFSFKDLVDIIKNNDELDEELESYLTEEEKKTIKENLKEEKRLTTIVMSILGVVICSLMVVFIIVNHTGTSDLIKITEPIVKEYYEEKYNKKISIDSTYYLSYIDDENKTQKSNIHITNTKDNYHIIGIDNKNLGDDIDIQNVYDEYSEYLNTFGFDKISSSPTLSYQDYYKNYNILYDYIKVLPSNKTYKELLESKKLTIRDIIFYQGNINLNYFKNLLKTISDDSKFILIENRKGIPIKVTILSKNENFIIDITNTTEIQKGITYYELNKNINEINEIEVKSIKESYINDENYEFQNAFKIEYDSYRSQEDTKANYYFFKFDASYLNVDNLAIIDTTPSSDGTYSIMDELRYPEAYFIKVGGSVYVIGTDEMVFANKIKKDNGLLCKLGLC